MAERRSRARPASATTERSGLRHAAQLLGIVVVTACASPEAEPPELRKAPSPVPIAELGEWQPWLDRLEMLDVSNRVGEQGMLFWRGQARIVYDFELPFEAPTAQLAAAEQQRPRGPVHSIVHLSRQLEQRGIELLVAVIPPREIVYPELTGSPLPSSFDAEAPPRLDFILAELDGLLQREGIRTIDLLPAFLAERFAPPSTAAIAAWRDTLAGDPPTVELLFRRQDAHWTWKGAAIAAREIAASVREMPWYDEVARGIGTPVLEEEPRWIRRTSTTARNQMARGNLSPDTPDELLFEHDVKIRGEQWNFNARGAPILLLGDSFSRYEHGITQALLRELGMRVERISVPMGNQSGQLQTLRARGDDLSGRRLVIWLIAAPGLVGTKKWQAIDLPKPPAP